jgi:hypothetical protein
MKYRNTNRFLAPFAAGAVRPVRGAVLFLLMGLVLLLGATAVPAASYYVSKTGSDTNPGTLSQPFLTVQRGINAATGPGDTVIIASGNYNEYVTSKASGTVGNPITIKGQGGSETILKAFRVNNHQHVILDSLTFTKSQNLWGSHVRVEAGSHHFTMRNCTIRDSALLIRDDWVFNAADNSISSPSGSDWSAAGFEVGGRIYCGAASIYDYPYANHDRSFTITSISANKVFVTPALVTETNFSAWAPIFSGPGNPGVNGVEFMVTGGASANNGQLVSNRIRNIYGSPFLMRGSGHVVSSNIIENTYSRAWIHPHGDNLTVTRNTVLNVTNWIHYSRYEGEFVPHAPGPDWYDYVQGHFHTIYPGTNVVISQNWLENIQQPLGTISEVPTARNWLWSSNVFVGIKEHMGNGVNSTTFQNNTFYQVSYDEGRRIALALGGNTATKPATNQWVIRNAFIDIGSHSSTNEEGFYSITPFVVNSGARSNFVAGPETAAWQGKRNFREFDGINGGDPLLVNPQNPRGPDGLAFTADDGLRPLPHSPLALLSIGALEPVAPLPNQPIAHLSVRPAIPGWYDKLGTDFDPQWTSLAPFARTNKVRPWGTPEALGNVPCEVFVDARGSISGDYATNHHWGIMSYTFDFGDGAVVQSWTPTNSHTYLWPGTFEVKVIVRNTAGNTATNSRIYRVLPQSDYPGTIRHVAQNGNDTTGSGSKTSPYASITKAVSVVSAGDYIAVHPGEYAEYVDVNRDVATTSGRIALHGFGAKIGGAQFRHSNWTIEGFDIDNNPPGPAGVYVFQSADNIHIHNSFFHDHGGRLFGAIYAAGSSTPSYHPLDQSLNGRIIGCTFSNINSPVIQIFGGSNWLVSNFRAVSTTGEGDFIRPRGANHTIQDGYAYGLDSGGSGGHPDFLQLDNQGGTGFWFKDILVQRVFVEGNTNSISDAQIAQIESGAFGDPRWTNFVIRSSIFKNVRGPINDSNDGMKIYNNLFYRSPRAGGLVTTGGGVRGSSYGTRIYNNIFFGCGLTDGKNLGWYQNGLSSAVSSNTTVFADHNFVAGISGVPKQVAPPDSVFYWAITGQEANGINGGNPLFMNEAAGDFRLAQGSPLLNRGVSVADLLGTSVDYLGNPLTVGAVSIGPFGLAGGGGSSPDPDSEPDLKPIAPRNPRLFIP